MNFKKIEKQLKKINQLFDTIKDDGTVSAIEKDLMLSYIRGLYEKVVEPQNNDTENISISKSTESHFSKEQKKEASTRQMSNIADVIMKEVGEADQSITNAPSSIQSATSTSSSANQEEVIREVVEAPKAHVPREILELFEMESINELSDKLSRSPISDLTKSMGINEKIFTVQELFGGDSALFTRAIESLDKMSSLEQARDYLVEHVAVENNWNETEKLKKAANFVKLVSRRY